MSDTPKDAVELRAYIEHWKGDEVSWQVVDGRRGESAERLYERGRQAMANRRGLMTKGVVVTSSCVVQSRTVTPWVTVYPSSHLAGPS